MSDGRYRFYPRAIRRAYSSLNTGVYRQPYRYLRLVPVHVEPQSVTVFPQTGTLTIQGQVLGALNISVYSNNMLQRIFRMRYYQRSVFRQELRVITRRYAVPYASAVYRATPTEQTLTIEGQQPTITSFGLAIANPVEGALQISGLQPILIIGGVSQIGPLILLMRESSKRRIKAARYAAQYQRPWIMGTRQVGAPIKPPEGRLALVTEATLTIQGEQPTVTAPQSIVTVTPIEGTLLIEGQQPTVPNDGTALPTEGTLTIDGQTPSVRYQQLGNPTEATLFIQGQSPSLTISNGNFRIIIPTEGALTLDGQTPDLSALRLIFPNEGTLAIEGQQVTIVALGYWTAIANASGDWTTAANAAGGWEATAGASVTWN